MRSLENAWRNICALELSVAQVESNPQLIQIVPPNEVVVLLSFEITMGDNRGIMNLCVPYNTIEPLSGKLSSDSWSAYRRQSTDVRHRLKVEAGMAQARIEITVHLAEAKLATADLMNLSVGDVIVTETEQTAGVEIRVESRPLFRGVPGVLKGRKAVRIQERIARPQDVIAARLKDHQATHSDDEDASTVASAEMASNAQTS